MPTPAELALSHTDLKPEELEHLQRLLGSWGVLADLSFSDLLLYVPVDTFALAVDVGTAPGTAGQRDVDFNRRIAARVQHFAPDDCSNIRHAALTVLV